jgi:hypothetical protein
MNDTKINLELDVNELNIVLTGLGKLPLEVSLLVWSKLKQEAEKQMGTT